MFRKRCYNKNWTKYTYRYSPRIESKISTYRVINNKCGLWLRNIDYDH